jgi:hypothetical protein
MVRRAIARGLIAAAAAPWLFGAVAAPALAQEPQPDFSAVFAVNVTLDDLAVAITETRSTAVAETQFPFSGHPSFRLGAPELDHAATRLRDRLAARSMAACGELSCEDLTARMAFRLEDDKLGFSIGARAGIADRLTSFGEGGEQPRWYVFVAADAQAMSFNFRPREDSSTIRLDDMRLLGDAQAGLATKLRGGDLAFGFVTREVEHLGAERTENFVGLTFGWEG